VSKPYQYCIHSIHIDMYQAPRTELRRLQRSGGSLVVAVPHAWAKALGLKKGDPLEARIEGRVLLLLPWKEAQAARRSISLRYAQGQEGAFYNELVAAYLDGYDDIRISAEKGMAEGARQLIRALTSKLLGLELVEEDGELLLRVMADASGLAPEQALRRMHVSTLKMQRWALEAALGREEPKKVLDEDEVVDRLYFYLVRLLRGAASDPSLALRLGLSPLRLLDFRVASQLLEGIGDKAVALAQAPRLGHEGEGLLRLLALLKEGQEQAFGAFLSRDMGRTLAAHETYERARELAGTLLSSNRGAELAVVCSLLLDIAGLWVDLADLAGPLRE